MDKLKPLKRISTKLCYLENHKWIDGPNNNLRGDCTDLSGDCSNLRGDCTDLSGDCSNLSGDCSDIPKVDREGHANIDYWVEENHKDKGR